MPLSDEERKQLRELEEELAAEDPRLARELESGSLWPRQSRGLLATLVWIAGLVLLIVGIAAQVAVVGILFGSTASEAAHGAERPLLIAREAPGESPFPKDILLACDGSHGSWEPVRAAAKLAAAFDAKVDVVQVADGKHDLDEETLAAQLAEVAEATGREPELAKPDGNATKEIVKAAKERGSSLIVAGRRGLHGLKALGSVSERIVGGAECSVLLIPVGDKA